MSQIHLFYYQYSYQEIVEEYFFFILHPNTSSFKID